MKQNKYAKIWVVLLLVISITGLSACDEQKEVENWIERISEVRTAADGAAEKLPYRNEQYDAFKSYFGEVNQMILTVRGDEKKVKAMNKMAAQRNFEEVCSKLFMSHQRWKTIMGACKKNRFFLCPEEVKVYPELITAIRDLLVVDQQARFDESTACQTATR